MGFIIIIIILYYLLLVLFLFLVCLISFCSKHKGNAPFWKKRKRRPKEIKRKEAASRRGRPIFWALFIFFFTWRRWEAGRPRGKQERQDRRVIFHLHRRTRGLWRWLIWGLRSLQKAAADRRRRRSRRRARSVVGRILSQEMFMVISSLWAARN